MPTKIKKFIPSRIGEPLTSFSINQDLIVFGSVSGYIGVYHVKSNKVAYDNVRLYENIIRDIWVSEDGNALRFAVGDECFILGTWDPLEEATCGFPFKTKKLNYKEGLYAYNACYSPAMISFVKDSAGFIGYFPSPACEKPHLSQRDEKPDCTFIDLANCSTKKLTNLQTDHLSYPMDFDGANIIYLSITKELEKYLVLFRCKEDKGQNIPLSKDSNYSYFKFFGSDSRLIYIKNYTEICQMEVDINKETTLLSHSKQILSYCFDKEVLYILDDAQNVIKYEHKNGRLISENLSKLPGYPEIAKDYKPFDMGYSYTMRASGGIVGVISDLGLFVLEIL